jgi:SAM-dependent methyltransferase
MSAGAARENLSGPIPFCPDSFPTAGPQSYADALAAEKTFYENCVDVHALPPIFHYWSNRYLLPKLQAYGFGSTGEMFAKHLANAGERNPHPRFVSLGSGNCDLEIQLTHNLKRDFTLDCVDLNPAMLERGRLAAESTRLSSHLNFIPADLNRWDPSCEYDCVIANQSLHHLVNLEGLFERVQRSLRPGGEFLIADMIGRNGHQRWPEALDIVREFWTRLPPSYRFNRLIGCYEEMYQNGDCSVEGFEGVRSQDILPLLVDRFHFYLFLPYGNVIDPFIDRTFGYHFDPAAEWDRSFIDEVHRRDEDEIACGHLKPTHLIAIVRNEQRSSRQFFEHLSPECCVRSPRIDTPSLWQEPPSPYRWNSWPHDLQQELEIACRRLAETGREIKQRTAWALSLASQLDERTAWAVSLEKDVQTRTAWAQRVEKELEIRTAWGLGLQSEVEDRTAWAVALKEQVESLERAVEERTLWALRVKEELAEQTSQAERLETELNNLIHHPSHLAARLLKGLRNRLTRVMSRKYANQAAQRLGNIIVGSWRRLVARRRGVRR